MSYIINQVVKLQYTESQIKKKKVLVEDWTGLTFIEDLLRILNLELKKSMLCKTIFYLSNFEWKHSCTGKQAKHNFLFKGKSNVL